MINFFSHHPSLIWVQVPLVCTRSLREVHECDEEDEASAWNEPWNWWSKFHERLEYDKRVGVVLELTADLPSQELLKRWLGEPVKAIIIPTSIFHNNKKGCLYFIFINGVLFVTCLFIIDIPSYFIFNT